MLAQHLTQTSHPPADHGRSLHLRSAPQSDRLKRAFDLTFALLIAVVAAPVIAAAWVIVRATSSGPGFYSQLRVGRHGRLYRIYKIRTMYHNCEAASGAAWCGRHDRRVTRVGRLLRKLHVDELPQLLNVLRGDMSLVGPRPERPEFVGPLAAQIPDYTERLSVRPGVTGLAQIQLPADLDVDDVRRKLVLDRCYAERCDLWLDVRIVVGTLVYLCGFSYGAIRKVMMLPNPLTAEQPAGRPSGVVAGPFTINRSAAEVDGPLATGGAPIPCGEPQ